MEVFFQKMDSSQSTSTRIGVSSGNGMMVSQANNTTIASTTATGDDPKQNLVINSI